MKIDPEILISSGHSFNFCEPDQSEFTIDDIAHSLSNICRFSGHVDQFYSVAQHSVLVSHIVPEDFALQGLLHDAAEAFLGDVALPLKGLLPDYRALEKKIEASIFARFGLPGQLHDEVKRADLILLKAEQRDLMSNRGQHWPIIQGLPEIGVIKPLPPLSAKALFLGRFAELTNEPRQSLRRRTGP